MLHEVPTYETYNARFMNADLDDYLEAADGADVSFAGRYPEEFLVNPRPRTIPAWHLVGGNDPIDASQLTGAEPDDGYPVLLRDWIRQDGLKCLKVKLRGNDAAWDHRPAAAGRRDRARRGRGLADRRLQLHGPGTFLCQYDS